MLITAEQRCSIVWLREHKGAKSQCKQARTHAHTQKHTHSSSSLLFVLPVVLSKASLRLRNVYLGAAAVDMCVCVWVCVCMCARVYVIIDVCCVNMLHPPLYMSVTASFFCTAQALFPPPPDLHSSSPLSSPRSPLWMTLFLDRALQRGCPPISDSILHHPPPTPSSHKPPTLGLCHMYASNYRDGVLHWCQTVIPLSLPLSPLPSLSLLSGPGRLGYALITFRILPSLPAASQQSSDSAWGIMGAPEEQWVSKHRAPE